MSRLQPLKTFIQFSQFIPASPPPQSSRSGRLCVGRTSGNPVPFYVLGRHYVSYIPFEGRTVPLNMLKNNGLMRALRSDFPKSASEAGTHAGAIKEEQCLW